MTILGLFIMVMNSHHGLNRNMIGQRGFTLIEAIIYVALFSLIMAGSLGGVYQIIQAKEHSLSHLVLQQEAIFLIRKIDWALAGAVSVDVTPSLLTVIRPVAGVSQQLDFFKEGDSMALRRNSSISNILNSPNVKISDVIFTWVTGFQGSPGMASGSFVLTTNRGGRLVSQQFSFSKAVFLYES